MTNDEDKMTRAFWRAHMISKYQVDPGDPDSTFNQLAKFLILGVVGFFMLKTWLSS